MSDAFHGRVAVVTGGASGIGLAMAQAFAARGAKLALADIREDALDAAVKEFEPSETEVVGIPTDVAFIAMAHHELGQADRARSALVRLGELMQKPPNVADEENQSFLREAELTIGAS